MNTNAQANQNSKTIKNIKSKLFFILFAVSITYNSIAQTEHIVVKIEESNPELKLDKLLAENEIKTNPSDHKSNTNNLISYIQLFPESNRLELKKYYKLEFNDRDAMIKSIFEIFPNKISYTVDYFEPQPLFVPNDFDFNLICCEDTCRNVGLSYLDLINIKDAWDIVKGNPGIVIGIHDSYLYVGHEDLNDKIFKVYDNNIRSEFQDKPDHCTMVAGIIAANTDNQIGISAVAFNCSIAKTSSNKNDLLKMAKDGIKVINISENWGPYNTADQELINELVDDYNITVVAAAGNCNSATYNYPASYENVISVTSVGHEFKRGTNVRGNKSNWIDCHKKYMNPALSCYTHQHNDKVDICAPGYNILTLCHPETYKNGLGKPLNQIYSVENGSSFAAAIVSGVCGLIYSVYPDVRPLEVEKILKSTALNIESIPENAEFKGMLGAGRIDAGKALKLTAQLKANADCNSDSAISSHNTVKKSISELNDNIKLYPNPASEKINVYSVSYNDNLLIYSSNGELVKQIIIQHDPEEISLSQLASGIYMTILVKNGKTICKEKFVKY